MFPPTSTSRPAADSIRPIRVVVVDFPFVPVTAMTGPRSQRNASSSSPMISTPSRRAASNTGCSSATPGLVTIRSATASVSLRCPPSSSSTPAARSSGAASNDGRDSVSVTWAPRRTRSVAAAIPLRAAPTTTTRRPATEKSPATPSPQLERRHAEQRETNSEDDQPSDHLRFLPPNLLEVVMQWRHLEQPLASGRLEVRDLEHDRGTLHDPDSPHDRQEQFLFDQDRDGTECAAEPERTDVAHEHFGGIRVEPQKSEARTDEGAAEDRQLAGRRKADQQQVAGKHRMTGDVGKAGEGG